MSYIDVYFSRINHMGETTAERIRNGGIRSFEKWLAESPHTLRNLSVERGIYFDGIILKNKDKEYEKIMFLEVANDVPLLIGDIMNWILDDGSIEKWILIQEEKKVNGTFRSFWIVRCNYLLKWIDGQGHLQKSWSYFVSSLDSKIKGNFRTWNNLITPQPNKYAEILMPQYPIERATNFIIENESWTVVEYDHSSVPGVIYLSLTEAKVNMIYDDLEQNIADLDKMAVYNFVTSEEEQNFKVGDIIQPVFTLMKNGNPANNIDVEIISTNYNIVNERLEAVMTGSVGVILRLKEHPEFYKTININIINEENNEFFGYIEGPDSIRLGNVAIYTFICPVPLNKEDVTFYLSNSKYASITKKFVENEKVQCLIMANNKNLLIPNSKEPNPLILTATYDNKQYTKEVSIIPLW